MYFVSMKRDCEVHEVHCSSWVTDNPSESKVFIIHGSFELIPCGSIAGYICNVPYAEDIINESLIQYKVVLEAWEEVILK